MKDERQKRRTIDVQKMRVAVGSTPFPPAESLSRMPFYKMERTKERREMMIEENVPLAEIEMDTSIQCRASIDTGTVNEYADAMKEGAEFPPVILFHEPKLNGKTWIGDGWHRVMASRQCGFEGITAEIRKGGRMDALRFALGANAANGLRRTNADKRRCVEIALAEFGNLSSRAIAGICGVDHKTVENARQNELGNFPSSTRTSLDGKQRPASMPRTPPTEDREEYAEPQKLEPVADPLYGRVDVPDIDRDEDKESDSPSLAGLKRYWHNASKKEKKAFILWTQKEGK